MSENSFDISNRRFDYSRYDLNENPFPYSPVPSEDPEIYCGQDHVAKNVSNTVSTVLGTGKSKHLVVTGKYGNGKSHTLKYTRSMVRNRGDVVVGYVSQPGEGFLDIYHEFMYDLGFDRIQGIAYEFLASVTTEHTEFDPSNRSEMKSLIDEGDILLSSIIPDAIQRLSNITKFADFARAIVHMVYDDTNLYAWQWLTGEGIRYEQRKEMEIHTALDDDTMGVRAFTALKSLLLKLGYTAVFVFIDEFESIARLSPKTEQSTLNSIRHLMDQNSTGLSLLFGCAPEVWQEVMSEYHAFSERIGREVALRPLTEGDTKRLVAKYLSSARDSDNDDIWPFAEESINVLLQQTQGNIRQVLMLCSQLLDEGIEQNQDKITADFVKNYLDVPDM